MLSIFLRLSYSFNSTECETLYSDSCDICISHFADRQCGFCLSLNKCISYADKDKCTGDFYYGPESTCDAPSVFTPTPTPLPAPTQIPDECGLYSNCEDCTAHLSDRNCGWCQSEGKCVNGTNAKCDGNFYYNNNAKCGKPTPTPVPTPWKVYKANTSFCKLYTDKWCTACVSTDPSQQCVWCFDTNECAMGDKDGFFFGTCKNYAYNNSLKCQGKSEHGTIVAVRVCLSIFVVVMICLGIFGCYKAIKQPAQAPQFEKIN